jgi:hypothetical protein
MEHLPSFSHFSLQSIETAHPSIGAQKHHPFPEDPDYRGDRITGETRSTAYEESPTQVLDLEGKDLSRFKGGYNATIWVDPQDESKVTDSLKIFWRVRYEVRELCGQ